MTDKAYTYTLEAVLSAILVLLCLMFVLSNIQVPHSEGNLKELGKGAVLIIANKTELLARGEYEDLCEELEVILPPDAGYYLLITEGTNVTEPCEKREKPSYPMSASHYLIAVNRNETLCLYDIEIILWWR